mmetsp:Transcript_53251/g.79090  ORF Transcript_53251/g.79090 Transcript_53251/m.79090 type:complete len:94 (-) Transcript_53251:348-629(-)
MIVTIDKTRVLHLFLLIVLTILGGYTLISRYGWNKLSAFGLSCSVTCQVSSIIMKLILQKKESSNDDLLERRIKGRNKDSGNPKKKRRGVGSR